MHRDINLYYNSTDSNQSYFPQSREFCVAKSPTDSNWYRARIIRLVGNEKAQLIFIDNVQLDEINVYFIQPLNSQYSDRPEQYVLFNLVSLINQKQFFIFNNSSQWALSIDQIIDLITNDPDLVFA